MDFEWDEGKFQANKLKHGVSFEDAVEAFDDPSALVLPDVRHSSAHEKREILIGKIDHGILIVVFTVRHPGNKIRIISARRANRKERRFYESQKS